MAGKLGDLVATLSVDASGYKRDLAEASQAAQQHAAIASQSFGAGGMSAKQYAFALRGVPAQFTDIFVSLQGGQKPLTVLLQQGGQLKDMFGGIGPALRAMGGYIASIINPVTLATAAIAGLGYAVYEARSQIAALSGANTKNGGILGLTPDDIADMAGRIGELTGKYGTARDAAIALASTGLFGAETLETAMRGVVDAVSVAGKSVEKVVEDFVSLAKDPLAAIQKLDDEYNFLTLDVYKHIESLVEQGKQQEAIKKAVDTFADTMRSRAGEMVENLGWIEAAWKGVTKSIQESWQALLNWGRQDTKSQQLAQMEAALKSARDAYDSGRNTTDSQRDIIAKLEQNVQAMRKETDEIKNNTIAKAENARANKESIAAYKDRKTYIENSKRASLSTELEKENEAFQKAARGLAKGSAEYNQVLEAYQKRRAALVKKFQGKAEKSDPFTTGMQSMQRTAADMNFAINNFERFEGRVKSSKEAIAEFDVTLGKLSDQSRISSKLPVLSAEQKAQYVEQGRYVDELAEKIRQINVVKKFGTRVDEFAFDMKTDNANRQFEIDLIGKTSLETEKLTAARNIDLEVQERIRKVNEEIGKKGLTLSGEQKAAHEANVKALYDQAEAAKTVAMQMANMKYQRENDPWVNMQMAVTEYGETARNVGKQVGDTLKDAFKGAEDAIVQFVTKGKISFGDLVESVLAGLVRIQAQKMISGLADGLTSVLGSTLGGFFEYNFGDGPGSAYAEQEIFGGARAAGGPVSSGKTYLVGERGPELFSPAASGTIIPNNMLGGSGGMSIQINHKNEGTKQEVSSSSADFDGNTMIINIVTRDIENDGPVSRAIMRNFGASRAAGAY
ncbi:phage tail length tape measure family protein [Oxalobacter formigenes]